MNITTKFTLGQTIWIIEHNKIITYTVAHILINIEQDYIRIVYAGVNAARPETKDLPIYCEEPKCFGSKEELLATL